MIFKLKKITNKDISANYHNIKLINVYSILMENLLRKKAFVKQD